MNAKKASLLLVILALAGSAVCFYATNLVLSDVSNMFYGAHDIYFISSIPGFVLALEFVMLTIYVLRRYGNPLSRKRITLHYLRLMCIFSVIGAAASILTGTVVYHGFFTRYPFPGYTSAGLVLHAALACFSALAISKVGKSADDEQRVHIDFGYVLRTIGLCLLVFYAYNRTGALIWAASYVQTSTLYLTLPFYLSQLLPMLLLVHICLYCFGVYKKHPGSAVYNSIIILVLDVIFAAAVIIIGSINTQFISAVSPAVAIERLLSKPVETPLHFGLIFAVALAGLFYAIWQKNRMISKKEKSDENSGRFR